jgi:beta-fructofuranosidase
MDYGLVPKAMRLTRRTFLKISSAAAVSPRCDPLFASSDLDNAALCRKLQSDPLRPQFHLLPAHNWMNDPNGPIFFNDRYHMFHQYNPKAAVWGNMNWAHATSPDLIHWHYEPIALSPTRNGYDRDGVFSGSAVLDHGQPTVIYTGVLPPTAANPATLKDGVHEWREVQCLAAAQDEDLRTWRKLPEPVIPAPPAGLQVTGFRDPYIWAEDDKWLLALGSGFYGKGGAVLLYSSDDLHRWTYLHSLVEGMGNGTKSVNPVDNGEMWECPDFFPLGKKHVLLVSTMGKVRWKVGTYTNRHFTPEKEGVVDWGSYYAAKTMLDGEGNRVLWGWIPETRPDAELIAAGWAGVMSLPRTLSLSQKNELQTQIHPATQKLRTGHVRVTSKQSVAERAKSFEGLVIRDICAELDFYLHPIAEQTKLRLVSENNEEFATIECTNKDGERKLSVGNFSATLRGTEAKLRLHLFLDGSVLEIFANDDAAMTARIYRIPAGPLRVKLDGAEPLSFDAWQMQPISKDRLTGSLCL